MSKLASHPIMSPSQALDFIETLTVTRRAMGLEPIPVMMWGQPGIGKSSIVKQLAKKHGRSFGDVRLLLKDPTQIAGLNYFNTNTNRLEVSCPPDFPDASRPDHQHRLGEIIILDELAAAPRTVQAAALQLVLDRQISEYTLPEDVIIIAAGNRAEDGNAFEEMPEPLRNRFAHIELTADFTSWKEWADDVGIHPIVLGYLENNQADFNTFEPKKMSGRYAFATPRSWERVSDALWSITDRKTLEIKNPRLIGTLVGSLVGVDIAAKLNSYYKTYGDLPKPTEILNGNIKKFDFKVLEPKVQQSARYAMILSLTHIIREDILTIRNELSTNVEDSKKLVDEYINTKVKNFINFMTVSMSDAEEFMAIAGQRLLDQKDRLGVYKLPEFRPFIETISRVISGTQN